MEILEIVYLLLSSLLIVTVIGVFVYQCIFSRDIHTYQLLTNNYLYERWALWSHQILLILSSLLYFYSQITNHRTLWIRFSSILFLIYIILTLYTFFKYQNILWDLLWTSCFSIHILYLLFDYYTFADTTIIFSITFAMLSFTMALIHLSFEFKSEQRHTPPAELTCSLLSYITFSYITKPLIALGKSKSSLETDDVPTLSDADSSDTIFEKLPSPLLNYAFAYQNSIAYEIFRVLYVDILKQGIFQLVGSSLCFIPPLALQKILQYISSDDIINDSSNTTDNTAATPTVGYSIFPDVGIYELVGILFGALLIRSICDNQNYVRGRHNGIRGRSIVITALYDKAMRADLSSRKQSLGKLNNLISVDAMAIQTYLAYTHVVWGTAMEILIVFTCLFAVLGVSAIGGIIVLAITLPNGYFVTQRLKKYQEELLERKDARIGAINEALNGIRIIKLFAWEENFISKVKELRINELWSLFSYTFNNSMLGIMWSCTPPMIAVVCFLIHTQLFGLKLTVGEAYASMAFFGMLPRCLGMFTEEINHIIQTFISIRRVDAFLSMDDVTGTKSLSSHLPYVTTRDRFVTEDHCVEIKNMSFGWHFQKSTSLDNDGEKSCQCSSCVDACRAIWCVRPVRKRAVMDDDLDSSGSMQLEMTYMDRNSRNKHMDSDFHVVLKAVNMSIPQGMLVACIGPTGSGKSTFLSSILGECLSQKCMGGSVNSKINHVGSGSCGIVVKGKISYATQTPWIQQTTVRENILFGSPMDQTRYNMVIEACALKPDLSILVDGDMTEIGEKGVNLSGGQQQRISLARAAYAEADIYLLDDPLSAVDAHVGDHIFRHLICEFLKGKSVILVTHQLSLVLPVADRVIYIDNNSANGKETDERSQDSNTSVISCCDPCTLYKMLTVNEDISPTSVAREGSHHVASFQDHIRTALQFLNPIPKSNSSNKMQSLGNALPDNSTTSNITQPHININKTSERIRSLSSALEPDKHALSKLCTSTDEFDQILGNVLEIETSLFPELDHPPTDDIDLHDINSSDTMTVESSSSKSIIEIEKKETGGNMLDSYQFYMGICGGWVPALMIFGGCVCATVSGVLQNYSIGNWTNNVEHNESHSVQHASLILFLICSGNLLFFVTLKTLIYICLSLVASQRIHHKLFRGVIMSSLSWFDGTPIGRIINRFSQDINSVDQNSMRNIVSLLDCLLGSFQVVLVISITIPALFIPLCFVCAYIGWVYFQYILTSRELKRLESVNNSPVFVQFSETLQGISIVRCFQQQSRFFSLLCHKVDVMNRCHIYLWISNRWLAIRMQLVGACVTGTVGLFVVMNRDTVGTTAAGLSLVYSLSFTDYTTFLARAYADCQMDTNCFQRIKEYMSTPLEQYFSPNDTSASLGLVPAEIKETTPASLDVQQSSCFSNVKNFVRAKLLHDSSSTHTTIPTNPTYSVPDTENKSTSNQFTSNSLRTVSISSTWPNEGNIEFVNVFMKYSTSPHYVLNGISFKIDGMKKVGIVGRTGAGKSSLITALFRTVEADSGSIIIDGIDILAIPLYTLRSRISVVPQDPVLFEGSIRSNLDPFNQETDETLWNALAKVNLTSFVISMPSMEKGTGNSISTSDVSDDLSRKHIAEKGSNLSVGQRQLLCLARAIVKKATVLVMDEATANVDVETDILIQNTIRKEFSSCTVLCVAHRLHTVAYYDYVMVMDKGKVMEFDSPLNLLRRRDGSIFKEMCEASGNYDTLYDVALKAEARHRNAE